MSCSRKAWPAALIALIVLSAAAFYLFRSHPDPTPTGQAAFSLNTTSQPASHLTETKPGVRGNFLGAEACAACHQKQYDPWKQSTHGRAGGMIEEVDIIARFDGQPLRFADATVTPTNNASGRPVFVLEPSGADRMEIEVDAAIGGGHMLGGGTQTFFTKFSDGTVRFLPFDFIRDENVWFVQLRKDNSWTPITPEISLQRDLVNWPPQRALGTMVEFSNCQNCHGSQVTAGYNPERRQYETQFTSLTINCESCHGPGRRHVEIMGDADSESRVDIGMAPLALLDKEESINICLQCHANKVSIREGRYLPGADFDSYFSVKFSHFWNSPWLPDGRVGGFGYQGNHLYSDCYLNGSMTCVDCHDPHSQHYRDVVGNRLTGRFDNRQCTGCHASKAGTDHSHHLAGSEGDRCTSCHMPFLQHQAVGRLLKFARSDHSIPIPRPGFDEQLGIENACQKCHADQGLDWQVAAVRQWYGEIKPHPELVTGLLEAGRASDLASAAEMLLAPDTAHPMAQTAGLSFFIQRYLLPGMNVPEPIVTQRLAAFTRSRDLDLKALALVALHLAWDSDPSMRALIDQAKTRLGDEDDPLRNRWAVAADQWGTVLGRQGDRVSALRCFLASLEIQPENVVSLSNLAMAYLRLDQAEACIATLNRAIALKPYQAALHFQLAQTLAQMERWEEARQALKAGLSYAPDDPMALRLRALLEEP